MTKDIGSTFRALHRPGDPFILVNVWDIGTARMAAAMGAQAIATSSAAHAFTLGKPDGTVTRDEAMAHAQDIVASVKIPVSGDFENGFGHGPEVCAQTVRMAAEVGLAGISIEDTTLPNKGAYGRAEAVERIRAAVAAARALPGDFVLVARADGVMNGSYKIDEAIARLQAYAEAGADCVYVPMPKTEEDLALAVRATGKPFNALAAGPFTSLSRADFATMGVARISLGSALARITHRAIHDATQAMLRDGDFRPLSHSIPGNEIDALLS